MSDDTIETEALAKIAALPGGRNYAWAKTPAGVLVFGTPKRVNYQLYRGLLLSEDLADKGKAPDTIFNACIVDPSGEAVAALFDQWPAIASNPAVTAAIRKVCGTEEGAIAKK